MVEIPDADLVVAREQSHRHAGAAHGGVTEQDIGGVRERSVLCEHAEVRDYLLHGAELRPDAGGLVSPAHEVADGGLVGVAELPSRRHGVPGLLTKDAVEHGSLELRLRHGLVGRPHSDEVTAVG